LADTTPRRPEESLSMGRQRPRRCPRSRTTSTEPPRAGSRSSWSH